MRCPYCKEDDDKVVDSRSGEEGLVVRRRRECLKCHRRYTTYERVEESPLRVVKKSGEREAFDRTKLRSGMWSYNACARAPGGCSRWCRHVHRKGTMTSMWAVSCWTPWAPAGW